MGIALPQLVTLLGGLALVILGVGAALLSQSRQSASAGQPGSQRA
jgi:hypothetical protein